MSEAKFIDFTLHLAPEASDNAIEDVRDLTLFDPLKALAGVEQEMANNNTITGNVMVLDTEFLRREPENLIDATKANGLKITVIIDPRDSDALGLVDLAASLGVAGIKFHPYFQNLVDEEFPEAVSVARRAEEKGLWITVCCSYGTRRVFSVSGVRLVAALAQSLKGETPLIGLHGGGKAVIELMSIAFETPNLLLETSYSLPFWVGSSVETDFAFAMRKLGAERWIYGSDHPFMPMRDSCQEIFEFFERHQFSDADIDTIIFENARRRFGFDS